MSLNLKTTETHWYVDENYVMREKSDADNNLHDSCETQYHTICAYRQTLKSAMVTPVETCLLSEPPMRYPMAYPGMQPMSRDHILYCICSLMQFNDRHTREWICTVIPPIIFDKGKGSYMNLQMWLWTKLITDKKIGRLFYPVALLQAVKNSLWNRMLNKLFGYTNREYHLNLHNDLVKLNNKTKASLYYPVYAIKLVATMLQYVPKNWFTKYIKRNLLKITPDKNWALKIMLGDRSVTEHDVLSFRPIDKPRFSQMINPMRNNTTFRYLTEEEMAFNCLDKDYLMYLWNNREKFYE